MRGVGAVTSGATIATVAAYVFHLVVGRHLGAAAFAPIAVLWTIQYVATNVVYLPVEEYAIRQWTLGQRLDGTTLKRLVGATTVAAVATAMLLRDSLLAGSGTLVVIAGVAALTYAGFALIRARVAARREFRAYAGVTAAEGLSRLALAVAALLIGAGTTLVAWTIALAPVAAVLWSGGARRATSVGDRRPARDATLLMPILVAGLCAQLLLGAAPIVVGVLGGSATLVSAVFVTFALVRGPLWIVHALMARVLPPLVELVRDGQTTRLRALLRTLVAATVVTAILAAVAGAITGDVIVGVLFGPAFAPSALLAATAAAGVTIAIASTVCNQVLIAVGHTAPMAASWSAGLLVSAASLLVPLPLDTRIGWAFVAGQIVAFLGLVVAVFRHGVVGVSRASRQSAPLAVGDHRPVEST